MQIYTCIKRPPSSDSETQTIYVVGGYTFCDVWPSHGHFSNFSSIYIILLRYYIISIIKIFILFDNNILYIECTQCIVLINDFECHIVIYYVYYSSRRTLRVFSSLFEQYLFPNENIITFGPLML